MTALPAPLRTRWQPLRAGLVDVFYYDAEEFWFHDGRLLLRGNNGTGKSKVLALLLPFLLDGDLSPHRVEPDADPKKRMEWNLLLGGEHPVPERLGYTWLEFGRLADDGTPVFCTLGCGLKAVAGRGIARHWFFVTDQRVGPDLALVDATGTALSRDRLADALADRGRPYDTATRYRAAVDEALFGLGEQRYGALVDLLVQLRQPQLSKRPSERALSDALTEALPPLDQAVVADVAEAFRSLEEDRAELTAMLQAHASTESFLGHYRRYARIAARRRSAAPRAAQQAYEKARAALLAAESEFAAADRAVTESAAWATELETTAVRLRARERALAGDPDAERLRAVAAADERAARDAERARAEVATAEARLVTASGRLRVATERVRQAVESLAAPRTDARESAARAGFGGVHDRSVDGPLNAALGDGAAVDSAVAPRLSGVAAELADRRQRAVDHLAALLDAADEARRGLTQTNAAVERLADVATRLADRRTAAVAQVEVAGRSFAAAVRARLPHVRELRVHDPVALLADLDAWVETLDGPAPVRVAFEEAGRAAATELGREEARLERRVTDARERRDATARDIARFQSGEHDAPPPSHTRDPAVRHDRPGAPLWQVVDFAPDVEPADRAGLEAALEASGILDAWLAPDGELRARDTGDVLVRPASSAAPPARSLTEVLRPAVDRAEARAATLTDGTVTAVLAAVGLGEHGDTWVAPDGRFRVGVLTGSWRKAAAQYIGRGAREAARRTRLAELTTTLATIEAELTAFAEDGAVLARRRATLTAELADLPDDEPLRDAHTAVSALAAETARLADDQAATAALLRTATERSENAHAALSEAAADLGLPDSRAGLDAVRDGLSAYRLALAGLWPTVRALLQARRIAIETAAEEQTAREEVQLRVARAAEAGREAESTAEEHRTLAGKVGAAVAEVQRQLAEVVADLADNDRNQRVARQAHDRAVAAKGRAEGRQEELRGVVESATAERSRASEQLQRFADTGLLTIALPDLETPEPSSWAPDPTVRLARQIERELGDVAVDDESWDRSQRRVAEELKTLTDVLAAQGGSASAQMLEDGIVVEVLFRGRPATVPDLTVALSSDVADRRRLLDEREREVLENHLVNEVASTLQELLGEAERQVGRMNGELSSRPTSTGMRLKLEWRPREDGPAGLSEARRRLLRQTSDAWSEDDRSAVGGFLQQRIAEVRLRNESGTWLEQLTEALDYRAWHRFVILRHQNGQWRPATGPASGGERVLAASVPLFAAASAHYGSAGNPHAPRLITLDEAFAGVDDNARARYLGLLAAFDLDVVMTSEREWGCYPEVPGLAIAQLARTEGIAAVLVSHWRWDGRRRESVPRPTGMPVHAPSTAGDAQPPALFDAG